MTDEVANQCSGCGASVYRHHLDSGIARYQGGKLLCAHCASDAEKSNADDGDLEFISLENEDSYAGVSADMSKSRVMASVQTMGRGSGWDDSRFKRPLQPGIEGGTRCRTFHSKLSEPAIEFMNSQINDWVDRNEDVVIKFATSTIGVFEGKHAEPNLILTVFY